MKNCYCTDNCGCSLSDKLTVGNINSHQYIQYQQMIPNTYWLEDKPISLNVKQLCLYSVEELLEELGKRNKIEIRNIYESGDVSVKNVVIIK